MSGIVYSSDGYAGDTYLVSSTDSSQGLSDSVLNPESNPVKGALIYVETNSIRHTFGVDATTLLGIMVEHGGKIILKSNDECKKFRFISKTAGAHATLHITPYYFKEV